MVQARTQDAATWDHVLKEDREASEDDKSYWVLQRLPQRALTELADATEATVGANGEIETRIKLGTQNMIALRYGLVDVRNFKDPKTKVELKPRPNGEAITPDHFIERLELRWQQELAGQIISGGGRLSKDEVEKPAPSPTT